MSALGRIRKMISGSAVVAAVQHVGFVYVVEAEGLVGVGHATAIGNALAYILAAVPSAEPRYIWAADIPGLEKRVCDLARADLHGQIAENGGWFRCTVDEARAAIRAAASACGVPDVINFDLPEVRS